MKKLVFMFVACATMSLAVSFSSCGNGAAADSAATDSAADSRHLVCRRDVSGRTEISVYFAAHYAGNDAAVLPGL